MVVMVCLFHFRSLSLSIALFGRREIVTRFHWSFPLVITVFDVLIVAVRSFVRSSVRRLEDLFAFLPFHERYRPRLLSSLN